MRTRITGVCEGHPVRIGLSGSRTVDYYLRDYLAEIACASDTESAGDLDSVDLLFEEDDGTGRAGAMLLPLRVHMVTDLGADSGDLSSVLSGEQRRQHRRRIRQLGHRYEISTRDEDFDRFYDRMYLPTMAVRHGNAARTTSRENARRELFRHGHLMLVYGDSHEPVAGSVNHIDGSRVNARLTGVLDGTSALLSSGATKSAGHFLLAWALERGYSHVDFQGCEPFLRKGTLQAKIDLGAGAEAAPAPLGDVRVRMSVRRYCPGVRGLLVTNPVVTVDTAGQFHATAFRDGDRNPTPVRRPGRGLASDTVVSLPLGG